MTQSTSPPVSESKAASPRSTRDAVPADRILMVAILLLVGMGLVMVYSASVGVAYQKHAGDTAFFLRKDLMWVGLGLVGFFTAAQLDYRILRRIANPMVFLALLFLLGVLLFGPKINGAKRWFRYASISFQPAEFAKLSLIIFLGYFLSRKEQLSRSFVDGFLPPLIVSGLLIALILKQPDLGTAVILWVVTLGLTFLAGTPIHYTLAVFLLAAPMGYTIMVNTPWRLRRFQAFIDPWFYEDSAGMQVTRSWMSISSGGATGVGLGEGAIKFNLPEAHTDYILAVIGEELGLAGFLVVVALFAVIIVRGFQIGYRAKDALGSYLAYGITLMVGLQALINISVVLGALPTKGLTLPFVSFGGSSLVIDLLAAGILLSISRRAPETSLRQTWKSWRSWLLPSAQNRALPGGGRPILVEP